MSARSSKDSMVAASAFASAAKDSMAAARAFASAADVINTMTLAQAFDYKEAEQQVRADDVCIGFVKQQRQSCQPIRGCPKGEKR